MSNKTVLSKLIDRILIINFKCEEITESKPKEKKTFLSKVYLNSIKRICRYSVFFLLRFSLFLKQISVESLYESEDRPIVSLTTFPRRMNHLWMVIYCLFNQTQTPGKIVLNLSNEEFPNGLKQINNTLNLFVGKGLEINFVDENLKPHNKYWDTFQKYPNRKIITVDDDLLYSMDTIERLMKLSNKFPFSVCSNKIEEITLTNFGFDKYKNWKILNNSKSPSHLYCALGFSGVLYPPNFRSALLFDTKKIKQLSPLADDLWLKSMEIVMDIKVASGDYYAHPLMLPTSQKVALRFSNADGGESGNDRQWNNLAKEYNLFILITDILDKHDYNIML